ncbi:GNAT family N-acetyltransferase [Candidatus Saccharibacteria bacterium]|nr:GNAT family N-acetyltransferase [Candidatus Saccharibacteria bacterium]
MSLDNVEIVPWQLLGTEGIKQIHAIEQQTWAPWLAASYESLEGRAHVNPLGQLAVVSANGEIYASLSTNQIDWSGEVGDLPSWDDVAGDPTDYSQTYAPEGNTTVLMSMNVHPDMQGQQLPSQLVHAITSKAQENEGMQYVIGSFRPSEFSDTTLEDPNTDFAEYVQAVREDGLPADKWLRVLTRMGMTQLAVDEHAMRVSINVDEFTALRDASEAVSGQKWIVSKRPGLAPKTWCGETGFFYDLQEGGYVYMESNVWGLLWERVDE